MEVDMSLVKVPSIALITTTTIKKTANRATRIPNTRLTLFIIEYYRLDNNHP